MNGMAVIGKSSGPFALSEVEADVMNGVPGERLDVAFDFAQAERGGGLKGAGGLVPTSVHAVRSRSTRDAARPMEHIA